MTEQLNTSEAWERLRRLIPLVPDFTPPIELHYGSLRSVFRDIKCDGVISQIYEEIGVNSFRLTGTAERHEFGARVELWVHHGRWPEGNAFQQLTDLCEKQKQMQWMPTGQTILLDNTSASVGRPNGGVFCFYLYP